MTAALESTARCSSRTSAVYDAVLIHGLVPKPQWRETVEAAVDDSSAGVHSSLLLPHFCRFRAVLLVIVRFLHYGVAGPRQVAARVRWIHTYCSVQQLCGHGAGGATCAVHVGPEQRLQSGPQVAAAEDALRFSSPASKASSSRPATEMQL